MDQVAINKGSGMFDKGHLYVALSRVRRLKDVQLLQELKKKDFVIPYEVRGFVAGLEDRVVRVVPDGVDG